MRYEDFMIKGGILSRFAERGKIKQLDVVVSYMDPEGQKHVENGVIRKSGFRFVFETFDVPAVPVVKPDVQEETTPENVPFVPDLPPEEVRAEEPIVEPPKRGRPAGVKK